MKQKSTSRRLHRKIATIKRPLKRVKKIQTLTFPPE